MKLTLQLPNKRNSPDGGVRSPTIGENGGALFTRAIIPADFPYGSPIVPLIVPLSILQVPLIPLTKHKLTMKSCVCKVWVRVLGNTVGEWQTSGELGESGERLGRTVNTARLPNTEGYSL